MKKIKFFLILNIIYTTVISQTIDSIWYLGDNNSLGLYKTNLIINNLDQNVSNNITVGRIKGFYLDSNFEIDTDKIIELLNMDSIRFSSNFPNKYFVVFEVFRDFKLGQLLIVVDGIQQYIKKEKIELKTLTVQFNFHSNSSNLNIPPKPPKRINEILNN